jgi:peptidoglycan/xylan/chitin deacetylase (PgdA/CDA1 family)
MQRGVILVYHSVNHVSADADPHMLVTAPEHLEAHIRMLLRRRYRFVTVEELLEDGVQASLAQPTAVLTFDDGWVDGLTVATPLLQRLGVRATFYVCPGWWGSRYDLVAGPAGRLLDEREARMLTDAGMELGSHSLSHPDLRKLDDDALSEELSASKAAIEQVIERPCRTFAYPFGLFDERVERAVGAAGYELALTWQPGPWRALATPRLPAPARHGAIWLGLNLLGIRRRWRQPPP